jgi:hypothetical protein
MRQLYHFSSPSTSLRKNWSIARDIPRVCRFAARSCVLNIDSEFDVWTGRHGEGRRQDCVRLPWHSSMAYSKRMIVRVCLECAIDAQVISSSTSMTIPPSSLHYRERTDEGFCARERLRPSRGSRTKLFPSHTVRRLIIMLGPDITRG